MSNEDSSIFTYSQNSVKIENGVKTYGIKLDDGRKYIINFPISNDDTKGIIADSNDNIHYIISRNSYLRYDDIYNLE